MAEGDFVRETEMGKKMDRNSESLSNSESENDSISRISSLVATKDRDFLLSPNEQQVLSLPLLSHSSLSPSV